jgi:hypothetical protein
MGMLRRIVCIGVVLALSAGVAFADSFMALITKVEGNKVTFYPFEGKGKDAKKGDEKVMKAAKDVKVNKGKFNQEAKKFESGDEIEGGLKHKMFTTNFPDKGIFARITTDDDNKRIKELSVFAPKKGKKQ